MLNVNKSIDELFTSVNDYKKLLDMDTH